MGENKEHTLYYRVIGTGHPVVFLHGFLLSNRVWEKAFTKPTEGYQFIWIDLPGHGASKNITCPDNVAEITQWVQDTIDEVIGGSSYALIGHSLGGYIALELMKKNSVDVTRCLLLNSNFWSDGPAKRKERDRIAKIAGLNHEVLIQEAIPHLFTENKRESSATIINTLVEDALQMNPASVINCSMAMKTRNDNAEVIRQHLDKIVVIQGVEDHIVPNSEMLEQQGKHNLPDDIFVFHASGHMSILESPELSGQLLEML